MGHEEDREKFEGMLGAGMAFSQMEQHLGPAIMDAQVRMHEANAKIAEYNLEHLEDSQKAAEAHNTTHLALVKAKAERHNGLGFLFRAIGWSIMFFTVAVILKFFIYG